MNYLGCVTLLLLALTIMMIFTTRGIVVNAAHYNGNNCHSTHRLFGISSSWGGSRMMMSHDDDYYSCSSTFPQQQQQRRRRRYDYHHRTCSRSSSNHHRQLVKQHRGRSRGGVTAMDLVVDMLTTPFYYNTLHRNINSLLRQQQQQQQPPRYSIEDYGDSGVEIIMELPTTNIQPNDVTVDIDEEQNILTIRGRCQLVEKDTSKEEDKGRRSIIVQQSEFTRSFRLDDDDIDIPQINVSLSTDRWNT